nr:MAG TPA: Minor capsid protein from bacteriophage [Caudoviricetes sp.]
MEEKEKLTIQDAENAQKGILALALAYPDYPKLFKADNTTIRWNSIKADRSIGLFPIQGAVYLKKYVSGSYVAQMPFQILYKCSPTTNRASIEAQEMLNNLAAWMEESGIEFKDPHLTLQSITRTSPVYGGEQDEKTVVYAINIQLKYFYKK